MKRKLISLIISLIIAGTSYGQLTGNKYIPGDYATVAAAIADLNAQGVGEGGVTFNVIAGHLETFGSATSGLITTQTALAGSPIIFRKDGVGINPRITSANGAGNYDYVICIGGTDYITFDGIDVRDDPAHSTGATQTEYGFLLAKAPADTSGTQYATIKNSTITLNNLNLNTVGINVRTWIYTLLGTNKILKNTRQTNSNNSFQGNTITNCFNGIYLLGYSLQAYMDQDNDVGSVAGNLITNFGAGSGTCNGIYVQYENNLIVANTSITGTVAGGTCYGMQFQSTGNASVNIYGNTISIQYLGTGSFYAMNETMGTTSTSNTIIVHDNLVTNCTFPNATSSTCYYMNIAHAGPIVSVYNNSVTNNTYGSTATTSTGAVYYMVVSGLPTTIGTASVYNNTVSGNVRLQSVLAGGTTNYMSFTPQCLTFYCYGNVCDNNSSATTGTAYGIYNNTIRPVNKYIYDNSVTNLSNANGTTYGIYVSGGYNWEIYKNKVESLSGTAATSVINGLYLGSTTGPGYIYAYNNIVGNLKTSNSTSLNAIRGIVVFGFNTNLTGLYNNTVFLNATSTGANFGTAGLQVSKLAKVYDIRNNIIVNTSTPTGTGKTIAVLTDSLNSGNLAAVTNNNNYYAGIPSSNMLIFSDGVTDDSTMLQYRTRVYPREYLSVSELPPFISSVVPLDLHLNPNVPTQCESGGSPVMNPIEVLTDYDGHSRYPNSGYPVNPSHPANAPDIGADEFGGIPLDLTPPFIVYAPLANIATTGNHLLTATISDVHGVPVSGIGLPRVYWKTFYNGTWNVVTGTHVADNQYTFSFGGGSVQGDTIYYYVAAQDMWATPNTGSNPFPGAGGFSANPPMASIAPSSPNKYVVVPAICGTLQVGTGGDYPTLTAAINDINTKGITCPVTLVLTDNTYPTESYPITLQPNGGSSSVNTLTIKPAAGVNPVFTGVVPASGLIKVNGFDYLVIDGSPNGGSEKNLTFQNASETNDAHVIGLFNNGGVNPASNITIKNSIIKGISSITMTNYGIFLSPTGGGYDGIDISDNVIHSANTGIYFSGNFSGINHNGRIAGNTIGTTDNAGYITAKGILLQYSDNTLIERNNIMGPETGNNVPTHAGIYILVKSTNTKIRKNLIHDFYRNVDDGSGAYGIWYEAEGNTITEISDNSIYGIKSSGAAPGVSNNNPYGIYIYSGGNIKILHNSIWLYGNLLSPTDVRDASSACIGIYKDGSHTNNLEIRNNIFKNSMQGLHGICPATGGTFGIMTTAPNAGNFSVIDNNDYYIDGCSGQVGEMNFINFPTIALWQAATNQEANSLYVNPDFTSTSDLFPTTTAMPKAGAYIPTLPTDITGAPRSSPPDMGAYEFSPQPAVVTNAATNVSFTTATLNGEVNPGDQNVNLYFDFGTTNAYGSVVAGVPPVAYGNSSIPISAPLSGLEENTTYHFRIRGVSFSSVTVFGNDMTFSTASSLPINNNISGTFDGDTCFNATDTIKVAGTPNTFVVSPTGSVTLIAGKLIRLLPGTNVQQGGYLHGQIALNGPFCNQAPPIAATLKSGETEQATAISGSIFSLYPNPTTGNFTLAQMGEKIYENAKVEVYNMSGTMVLTDNLIGQKQEFRFSGMPHGVYFVKIMANGSVETIKLVIYP
jgi:hypothetical protein